MPKPHTLETLLNRTEPEPNSGCWLWCGGRSQGYGHVSWARRKQGAHRVFYQVFRGDIPDGHEVDHLCRNAACVNPGHLEAVTPRENTLRSGNRAAQQYRQTHCKRGHHLWGDNLYTHGRHRRCKTCISDAGSARYAANRAVLLSRQRDRYAAMMRDPILKAKERERLKLYKRAMRAAGA